MASMTGIPESRFVPVPLKGERAKRDVPELPETGQNGKNGTVAPARRAIAWRVYFTHRQPAVARFDYPATLAEVWQRFHRDGVVGAEPLGATT